MNDLPPDYPLLSLDDIRAAQIRIAPYVKQAPIVAMTPTGLRLKAESLHPVGAFKLRGAFNAILSLPEAGRKCGVIAHSSGNHAQAVAYAAHVLGIKAAVVMPGSVSRTKLEATRHWGAEIHLVDPAGRERAQTCEKLAQENGYAEMEPYNSLAIMAGTGTIGLEILAQCPDVQVVTVPVSGGGLIGGISAALAQSNRDVRVIGVEPELAADARESFRAGRIIRIEPELTMRSMADGLRVAEVGPLPFAQIRAFVHDIVTVSEEQIAQAMRRIAREARLVAEPSGAVAAAGALAQGFDPPTTVAILSGGNMDLDRYAAVLAG
ncbi:MAG TPA: threonine/serine dehydratase [Rhizomicrobium sp.]|jgi:threonine dehydratase|nr:threonine/serine dehydratase [Rhizomicrobium sp.]